MGSDESGSSYGSESGSDYDDELSDTSSNHEDSEQYYQNKQPADNEKETNNQQKQTPKKQTDDEGLSVGEHFVKPADKGSRSKSRRPHSKKDKESVNSGEGIPAMQ